MSRYGWLVGGLVVLGTGTLIAISLWQQNRGRQPIGRFEPPEARKTAQPDLPRKSPDEDLAERLGVSRNDMIEVGGVKRPRTDIVPAASSTDQSTTQSAEQAASGIWPFPGTPATLAGSENESVAQLSRNLAKLDGLPDPDDALPDEPASEKAEEQEFDSSTVSAWFLPRPFEREQFLRDPASYIGGFNPGKVFQPAQPGPEVTPLKAITGTFQRILQGEKVVLSVEAEPGMPVSFYTPQVGEFENRLTSITVTADEEGVATATYLAGPGSMGLVDILAASPVHSGQLAFRVNVALPNGAGQAPASETPTPAVRN